MLTSIETTPNPNSMKLNLSESLRLTGTFTQANQASVPPLIRPLLALDGVQSIFVSDDFLTLNRDPRVDWQTILDAARRVFFASGDTAVSEEPSQPRADQIGQVQVLVQTFRDIPIQVKVTDGTTEERVGLPAYFGNAARELQAHFGADYLKERYWADWGVRYGTLTDVARDVLEEVTSLLDEATLNRQKQLAQESLSQPAAQQGMTEALLPDKENQNYAEIADWHQRLRLIQTVEANEENLPLLLQALHDEQPQIRRWVAAKLASVKTKASVDALSERLLNDPNVGVRRTAGDSLSDIGDASAETAVCKALGDDNKLVRWRAARFLTELGTWDALPFLENHKNETEYEVRLEIVAAIRRIKEGTDAPLPVWKQMSQNS